MRIFNTYKGAISFRAYTSLYIFINCSYVKDWDLMDDITLNTGCIATLGRYPESSLDISGKK